MTMMTNERPQLATPFPTSEVSSGALWTGRVLEYPGGAVFDLRRRNEALQARARRARHPGVGLPGKRRIWLGALEIICLVLYLVPRTALLGARSP